MASEEFKGSSNDNTNILLDKTKTELDLLLSKVAEKHIKPNSKSDHSPPMPSQLKEDMDRPIHL